MKDPIEETAQNDDAIGAALKGSVVVLAVLLTLGGAAAAFLLRPETEKTVETTLDLPQTRDTTNVVLPKLPFADITAEAGIDFVHVTGATGEKLLPETMGGGCAFLDYDGDGDHDILLINSDHWPWSRPDGATPHSVLYSNDGHGQFTDVSENTGISKIQLYGMGVSVGDYDNDGDPDLFITAVGDNKLYRNDNGVFTDVTKQAQLGGEKRWSTSAAWFDYNNDGRLDLFVCNYIHWSKEVDSKQAFRLAGVGRAYGPPTAFDGDFPQLYRNDGDDGFTDVSSEAGIEKRNPSTQKPAGKSMGVVPVDYDGDGWMDLIVANDTVDNFVFHNLQNGKFEEIGTDVGVAVADNGKPTGAMGVDVARHRNSDALAIAIGNYSNEMSSLYISTSFGMFEDIATSSGLGPQTLQDLTFGVCFADMDLDGRLDLLCANGHLEQEINKVLASQHYKQPPQVFWNNHSNQGSEFVPLTDNETGGEFSKPMVGRGATFADIDGDGDLDVLLTASGGAPRLLRNDQQLGNAWLQVDLTGVRCNRDAIGAWVSVTSGERRFYRQVMPARSYLSQVPLTAAFGLGEAAELLQVEITWPDGSKQSLETTPNQRIRVRQTAEAGESASETEAK